MSKTKLKVINNPDWDPQGLIPDSVEVPNKNEENENDESRLIGENDLKRHLQSKELELLGSRERLSGGVMGPIYSLTCRNIKTGEILTVVEKTYVNCGGKKNQRYERESPGEKKKKEALLPKGSIRSSDFRKRFQVIDGPTGEQDIIVDWAYNERKALEVLEGIKGVPKFYGAVDKVGQGSILMENIEGEDLMLKGFSGDLDRKQINQIFDSIKETFNAAYQKGILHLYMDGSTIMLDKNMEPYITDWNLHSEVSSETGGLIQQQYETELARIENRRRDMLDWVDEHEAENKLKEIEKNF